MFTTPEKTTRMRSFLDKKKGPRQSPSGTR
jgi:hypothetical protein